MKKKLIRTLSLLTLTFALIFPVVSNAAPIYQKKDSWQETIRCSREALIRRENEGETWLSIPDLASSNFTISFWIQTEQSNGVIFAKSPEQGQGDDFQAKILFLKEGVPAYRIRSVGTYQARTTINDGKWHHIALLGSDPLQFVIDGVPEKSSPPANTEGIVPESSEYFIIVGNGEVIEEEDGEFIGSLDEMSIFNRRLSPHEIKTLCRNPSEIEEKLSLWWQFEDDQRVRDSSGHGRNARLFRAESTEGKFGNAVHFNGEAVMWFSTRRMRRRSPKAQLWERISEDFSDAQSKKQIDWERKDEIWEENWETGNFKELAQRYARATRNIGDLPAKAMSAAAIAKNADGLQNVRRIYYLSLSNQDAYEQLNSDINSFHLALAYLTNKYGDDFPSGGEYLEQLGRFEKRISVLKDKAIDNQTLEDFREILRKLQIQALVSSNPLFDFDKLLFVKRYTYQSSHYYSDFIDGCRHFGGNISILSLKNGTVTDIAPSMQKGIFGRYDVHFDAEKLLFDWKKTPEKGFRIYEIGVDGKNLRQLTFEPHDEQQRIEKYDNSFLGGTGENYNHHTDDLHPCYLPDGGICFSSTRCEYGTLCDSPDILSTAVLYRIDGDGDNLVKLTDSAVSEFSPGVMHDGRILYSRWEYVDKGQIGVKCLWAMRPDGTGSVEIFGNDIALPPVFIHSRQIPGYNNLFVVLGTPHFPQSGVGTVIRLDINKPVRTREPMRYITPAVDIRTEGGFHHKVNDRWVRNPYGPLYMDPYPLDEKFFLVSHNPDKRWNNIRAWGLYLIDEFGNHVSIYKDPEFSCWQPMPLKPRPKPPVIPPVIAETTEKVAPQDATVVLNDVYVGLEGIEKGTIKYLRIMEQVPRPWGSRRFWDQEGRYGGHTDLISSGPVLGLKVLYGVVPVYKDGSAHFVLPPDRNIYFQALDENFMEIQRQRTYVNYRPGEKRSCIGCHELRQLAPENKEIIALQHPPSKPQPQPGEKAPRVIHFPTDVQPILDKHCIKCHGNRNPSANLNLTGEMTERFSRSYENILRRNLVVTTDEGSDFEGTEPVPPKTIGSHASKLIQKILNQHQGVKLTKQEMIKITTWVDANAQYYGTYYGRKHIIYKDHPDFRPVPTFEEAVSKKAP